MSSPRYDWWSYVKGMIRRYPALEARYRAGERPKGERRPTWLREYDAVRQAIEATERRDNGRDRLAVIDMVLWKQSHNLVGAALRIPCHEDTAKRWHGDFIRLVAAGFGLMDE